MGRFSRDQLKAMWAKFKQRRANRQSKKQTFEKKLAQEVALIKKSGLLKDPNRPMTAKQFADEVMLQMKIDAESNLAAQKVHDQYKRRDMFAAAGIPTVLINELFPVKYHHIPVDASRQFGGGEIDFAIDKETSRVLARAGAIKDLDAKLEKIDALERDERIPEWIARAARRDINNKLKEHGQYIVDKIIPIGGQIEKKADSNFEQGPTGNKHIQKIKTSMATESKKTVEEEDIDEMLDKVRHAPDAELISKKRAREIDNDFKSGRISVYKLRQIIADLEAKARA